MVSESVIRNKDTNFRDNVHEAVAALRVRSGIKTWAFIAV